MPGRCAAEGQVVLFLVRAKELIYVGNQVPLQAAGGWTKEGAKVSVGQAVTFCPNCEHMAPRRVEERQETYNVRGAPIHVDARVAVCDECGADIFDPELDGENLERAYNEYRQAHDVVAPEDIRRLRLRYGLSQRGLGRLLDWGEVTVHRYETGALPDSAHSDLLLELQDDDIFERYFRRHRTRLRPIEQRKVEEAIQRLRKAHGGGQLGRALHDLVVSDGMHGAGNRDFDFERFGQMVVYFTCKARPPRTKLLKLLWYADFLSYKRLSVSLSGVPYAHADYGPVPDEFNLLLSLVEREGLVRGEDREFMTADGVQAGTEYVAEASFDSALFSEDELDVLEAVDRELGRLNAAQIRERSHRERAWQETRSGDIIPYAMGLDLSLD